MIQAWLSLTLGIGAAWAQPYSVQFAREGLGRSVMVSLNGQEPNATYAGKLFIRDRLRSTTSVCANVGAPIRIGQFFRVRNQKASTLGGNYRLAANIVAACFAKAKTADQCAGLQLAVWEAIEDGGAVPNFYEGRFRAQASQSAITFAQQAYATAGEPGDAIFLESEEGGQDQLVPIN